MSLHCTLAAVQCIVIAMSMCLCVCVCVWVCYHDNLKNFACIDPHETGFVGKGSDRLQLIKFWPSCALWEGGLRHAKNFGLCLTTASTQCLRLLWALFSFFFDFQSTFWLFVLTAEQFKWLLCPTPRVWGMIDDACLMPVCLTSVCLSVTSIGPNSRT